MNCIAVFLFYSAFDTALHVAHPRKPLQAPRQISQRSENNAFLLQSQNLEGIIRGFGTGVPIWTASEVGIYSPRQRLCALARLLGILSISDVWLCSCRSSELLLLVFAG